ncbi:MAG: EI24 domain-containing protein [Marinosulfonomonas sp.]|nr:EI24 domain-containing protein [Marinosulfonomonas sp.]
MIFSDFFKALGQLGDARFRRVLLLGIGLTFALLFAAYAVILWLVNIFAPDVVTLPFVGEVRWVDDLLSWGSVLLMIMLSAFLMVPVASAFTSLFLDDVADAVEDRHFPTLPRAVRVPFVQALQDTLNFLGLLIVANALALILYLIFLPLGPLIFWGLNGFLLGREYFQLVAMRRIGRQGAKEMFRANLPQIWLAGALMAVPLSVPLVNLLIPILGAATFTHLFHRLNSKTPAASVV